MLHAMKPIFAALILTLLGCASHTTGTDHGDLLVAMQTWAESDIGDYRYDIDYWNKGCKFLSAQVFVEDGVPSDASKIMYRKNCGHTLDSSVESMLATRNMSELFAQMIHYQQPGPTDFTYPTTMRFNAAVGYPVILQLDAAFDDKVFYIPIGSKIPRDYVFRVSNFRAL